MRKSMTCVVEGCTDRQLARGWCRKHYNEWHRYGNIIPGRTGRRKNKRPLDIRTKAKSLQEELDEVERIYASVVGTQMRVKWRKKLVALRIEAEEMKKAEQEFKEAKELTVQA